MAFIRRRSRGNTYYYELVDNKRVGGKVRQKVLEYFPSGKEAREYAERAGIPFDASNAGWLEPRLGAALERKLAELDRLRPLSPEAVKQLGDNFEVDMTYHSNAIEGNRLSLRETWLVLRKGVTIRGKTVAEHLEATNHAEAIGLLGRMADRRARITETDVLDLHAVILDKIDPRNAGLYRQRRVFIQGANIILPDWRKVPGLMMKVYSELNDRGKGTGAVTSAVKVHHETVRIHPFIDGNGRLSRLLMNLRLMRAGFPPTILRREERRSYYSALEKADKGDFRQLAMLIAKDVDKSLDLYLGAARD